MPIYRSIRTIFFFAAMVSASCAEATDYQLIVVGGRTTMQGGDLPFSIRNEIVPLGQTPVVDEVRLEFIDQASGHTLPYNGIDFTCVALCSGNYPHYSVYGIGAGGTVALPKFIVSPTAPPGVHTILIRGTSINEGVVRTLTMDVNVLSQAQITLSPVPFPPGIGVPQKAKWESDMAFWGLHWCDAKLLETIDQSVTFYDGPRVYYQIRDYTGDSKWDACTRFASDAYSTYVNTRGGSLQGYYVFTKGMRIDSERTGNAASALALQLLYAKDGWWSAPEHSTVVDNMRENSYGLQARLDHTYATGLPDSSTRDLMQGLLGQLDQIFIQKKFDWYQPFMVGLAMDALIQYYNEIDKDPRIPYMIKQVLDGLWTGTWTPDGHGFPYRCYMDGCYNSDDGTGTGSAFPPVTPKFTDIEPNLNNLIAPAFAWIYLQTGDPKYRERGDSLFANGVLYNAINWKGKEFSQNYRWSVNFIRWRDEANAKNHVTVSDTEPPTVAVVSPKANATLTGSPLVIADASDNLYTTAVQFKVDGIVAGAPLTTRPFEFNLATYLYSNGTHNISAVAYDAAGNSSESAPISFVIQNPDNSAMAQCPTDHIPSESFQGCYYQHGYSTTYLNDLFYDVNGYDVPPAANLGTLTVVRNDPAIHFDWGTTNPAPGVDNSFFAVIWQGKFFMKPGAYTFSLKRDQGTGLRVYVDGRQFFEGWWNVGSPDVSNFTLSYPYSGTHLIRVELWHGNTNTGDSLFHPFDVSWVWNALPAATPMPDPILRLPGSLPLNSNIRLDNAASYTNANFTWTFAPQSLGSAHGNASKAAVTSASLGATSQAPQFSPASLNLAPGPYLVSVQANDGTGYYTNTVSAPVTLTQVYSNAGVSVYPNPWRSDKHQGQFITFDQLQPGAVVKIFTVAGRLVRELPVSGASIKWDLMNESGKTASSGIYLYLVNRPDGSKAKGKLTIVK